MTKRCRICGREYEPSRKNQPTCGDIDCKRVWKLEYTRAYGIRRREEDREAVNSYNREWMRNYRAKQRQLKASENAKRNAFRAEGYAERQIADSLRICGKVRIEL